jgi:hypothetical protein
MDTSQKEIDQYIDAYRSVFGNIKKDGRARKYAQGNM